MNTLRIMTYMPKSLPTRKNYGIKRVSCRPDIRPDNPAFLYSVMATGRILDLTCRMSRQIPDTVLNMAGYLNNINS
jgi:hypothetical protein